MTDTVYVQQCTGFFYFAKFGCHTFFSTSHNKMLHQTQRLWALQDQVATGSVSGFSYFQISVLHRRLFPPILSESKSAVCRNFISGSPVSMLWYFTNVSSCCMLEISLTSSVSKAYIPAFFILLISFSFSKSGSIMTISLRICEERISNNKISSTPTDSNKVRITLGPEFQTLESF